MPMLIFQAFVLTAIAVGAGVLAGVLAKQWFGQRTVGSERLADVMAAADAAETVAAEAAQEGVVLSPVETPAPVNQAEPVHAEPLHSLAEPDAAAALIGPAAQVSAGLDRIVAADRVGERPPALPAPRIGGGDDLRRIRGVGPQNAARLNGLGIYHFDQIAAWTPSEVRWIGTYLAFPGRIEREDWIAQATRLVADSRPDA
jgi:predicted flap endonuclease-1-like 5' DNA nuclease